MTGIEIINILESSLPVAQSIISAVAGSIFTALFLRKNTSTQEFEKLKAGKMQEVANDLLDSGKITITEYYKANNFLSIAKKADEEYSKMPHLGVKNLYDFDWFVRFYESAGNVSDEEMQAMWSKVLAGEINKPRSYSLRTLDVMRNLSKSEAEMFSKVCRHCIQVSQKLALPNYDSYLDKCGITYSDILRLDEIGLINSNALINLNMKLTDCTASLINKDLVLLISAKDKNVKQCSIPQFPFTYIGTEVATLIGDTMSDEDFIFFAKEIAKNQSINVGVHRINCFISDSSISYDSKNILND